MQPLHLPSSAHDASRRRFLRGMPALAAALALGGCASPAQRTATAPNIVVPFSGSAPDGALPRGWLPYVLRRDLPPTDYRMVERQGQCVLNAHGTGVSSGLRCAIDADPRAQPWLRWRWQAEAVPPGMSVAADETDDAPARVVVAFEGDTHSLPLRDRAFYDLVELLTGQRLPYATLMYVWDAQLPVGTVVPNARTGRIQYLVVESGAGGAGRWLGYERNLDADFRKVFGEAPGRIGSVGVLTDSDDLKLELNAWYGDIGLYAA